MASATTLRRRECRLARASGCKTRYRSSLAARKLQRVTNSLNVRALLTISQITSATEFTPTYRVQTETFLARRYPLHQNGKKLDPDYSVERYTVTDWEADQHYIGFRRLHIIAVLSSWMYGHVITYCTRFASLLLSTCERSKRS